MSDFVLTERSNLPDAAAQGQGGQAAALCHLEAGQAARVDPAINSGGSGLTGVPNRIHIAGHIRHHSTKVIHDYCTDDGPSRVGIPT